MIGVENLHHNGLLLYPQDFLPIHDFKRQHIVSACQFDRQGVEQVLDRASQIDERWAREGKRCLGNCLRGGVLVSLFYAESTRTRLTFESAMARLGGGVVSETDVQFSSRSKGESLEHTIRVVSGLGDVTILRDPKDGSALDVLPYTNGVPLINGGDGKREHPTQGLKDCYTLKKEFGHLDDLEITFLGDLKHGRTVHSLARLLSLYNKIRINLVAPAVLRAPEEMVALLKGNGVEVNEFSGLEEMDREGKDPGQAIYVTRLQTNLMDKMNTPDEGGALESLKGIYRRSYSIDSQWVKLHPHTILLHPLPIGKDKEISEELDFHPQSRFFEESDNGQPVAAALLTLVLGVPVDR